jgi:hypothetical protein
MLGPYFVQIFASRTILRSVTQSIARLQLTQCCLSAIADRGTRSQQVVESVSSADQENEDGFAIRVSVLTLADLAGSDGMGWTGAEALLVIAGASIDRSLLTLSTVIHRLSKGSQAEGVWPACAQSIQST